MILLRERGLVFLNLEAAKVVEGDNIYESEDVDRPT